MTNSTMTVPDANRPVRRTGSWHALALPALAIALMGSGVAQAQVYTNVTVGGQFAPGVYGQISIGDNPPPPVINVRPVIVGQPVYGAPIVYMHVPLEESRDWGRYCAYYGACGRPVQFVRVGYENRWWERHGEHLRGQDYNRGPAYRQDDREDFRREDRGHGERWGRMRGPRD